jgi:hypothetical protein
VLDNDWAAAAWRMPYPGVVKNMKFESRARFAEALSVTRLV